MSSQLQPGKNLTGSWHVCGMECRQPADGLIRCLALEAEQRLQQRFDDDDEADGTAATAEGEDDGDAPWRRRCARPRLALPPPSARMLCCDGKLARAFEVRS